MIAKTVWYLCSTIYGVLLTLSGEAHAPTFSADTAIERNPDYSFRLDCSMVIPKLAKPNEVWVRLIDRTESKNRQRFAKLRVPACKSALGGLRASRAFGVSGIWFHNLQFILMDDLSVPDMARYHLTILFSNNPTADARSGDYPRQIEVGARLANDFSEPVVTWILGHEIGHGVYEHVEKSYIAGIEGLSMAVAGGAVFVNSGRNPLFQVVGLSLIAYGAYRGICGRANLTLRQEIDADAFGVRSLQQIGYSLQDAKVVASKLFDRKSTEAETQDNAEKCVSSVGVNLFPHPSKRERLEAIKSLR